MKKLLDKLDRKYGRYGIENLMMYIIGAMIIVHFMDMFLINKMDASLNMLFAFDRAAIFRGELWRIFTFAFMSPDDNLLFLIFSLYFLWLMGNGLEQRWGTFKFNVFYFSGLLFSLIAGFILGYATNGFVNLTLFLAFAAIYPDHEILLFFFIPVKVKYLAILDAISLAFLLIILPLQMKLAILVAVGNFLLFFGSDIIDRIKYAKRRRDFQNKTNRK